MTTPPAGRGVKRGWAPDHADAASGFLQHPAGQGHGNYFSQDYAQAGGVDSFATVQSESPSESSASPGHPYHLLPTPSHDSADAPGSLAGDQSAPRPSAKATHQGAASTSFRNVSACNRCRIRKNRCDQHLPACRACEKAGVKCVGFDPISRREIPRSYVYFLEERTAYLERLLADKGIPFLDGDAFAVGKTGATGSGAVQQVATSNMPPAVSGDKKIKKENRDVERLVSDIGMVSVKGASDSRYLGSTSGISFARVVFAALKKTASRAPSELGGTRASKASSVAAGADGPSMRDSFFGLHTKPNISEAPFPDRELGMKLVNLYFNHANPQIPILHRGEFMALFDRVYDESNRKRTARESFMLNIVFAIGSGIIMGAAKGKKSDDDNHPSFSKDATPSSKRQRLSNQEHQPEEYHASAIVHLESFLGSSPTADHPDGSGGGLEELQAVCLLAGFALLRPVAPGLWYIVGVAVRLGVDLGLHHEEGQDVNSKSSASRRASMFAGGQEGNGQSALAVSERGRREWVRDLRRRLWWCVYSFDRLVSSCVGRPFGISDQAITTEFPSLLEDEYISPTGFAAPQGGSVVPSSKFVAHHYFRLRLLQSEILQVLQYENAQRVHSTRSGDPNPYIHSSLPSPFLQNFRSFSDWRGDVDRRLWEWKQAAPTKQDAGVDFSPLFFELNYWQAVIMLFRPSLTAPAQLASEMRFVDSDVTSPTTLPFEDNEEFVLLKIAEAGQKVLKLYRQLHRIQLVNYTFLATHHLFMAGISFLYAIWHSPVVRSHLSLDDVDFTVLAATSVLGDLMEKCPPAEICRDAFDRMSKATIQMCMSTTGFGPPANPKPNPGQVSARVEESSSGTTPDVVAPAAPSTAANDEQSYGSRFGARPPPQFDMNLKDLFADDEAPLRSVHRGALGSFSHPSIAKQDNVQPQLQQQTAGQGTNDMNIDPSLQQTTQSFPPFPTTDVPMQFHLSSLDSLDFDAFSQADGMDPNLWGFGDGDVNHDWGAGNGGVDVLSGFWFGNGGNGSI